MDTPVMPEPMRDERLAYLASAHLEYVGESDEGDPWCLVDDQFWPCDAKQLIDEVRRLTDEVRRLTRALQLSEASRGVPSTTYRFDEHPGPGLLADLGRD